MSKTPTAFFISYAFPPNGGGGVQRVAKFVKFLPGHGVEVSVLTARAVFKTTSDSTLLQDIDPATPIIRTATIDPMFVADFVGKGMAGKPKQRMNQADAVPDGKGLAGLKRSVMKFAFPILLGIRDFARLPDQYVGWFPFAFVAGWRHLRKLENPVIFASIPVYTTALVGYALSRVTGAPLILDFRDDWIDSPYNKLPTRFHRWFNRALEGHISRRSKHLIVYGEWLENIFRERYPDVPRTTILNGFDADDFAVGLQPARVDSIIRLTYSGSIFPYYSEFIEMFFQAVAGLHDSIRGRLEITFAGDIQLTTFDELAEQYGLQGNIKRVGYLPHKEAMKLLLSADAILFSIPSIDISSYSGKIFEYLASRRPIISFVREQGAGANLLKDFGHGQWIIDYDPLRAQKVLEMLPSMREIRMDYPPDLLAKIDRREQARELAAIIKDVAEVHGDQEVGNNGT
jgi:glycosyltransferase involved in cell wall biosynthesis